MSNNTSSRHAKNTRTKRTRTNSTPKSRSASNYGDRDIAVPVSAAARRVDQVTQVLGEVLQWAQPADQVLSIWMRKQKNMGARDRAEVTNAVFNVLRNLRLYRQFVQSIPGSNTRGLAILGLAATVRAEFLKHALSDDEAHWLTHVQSINLEGMPFEVRYSLPDWLAEILRQYPEPEALAAALNEEAPMDLRINPLKTDRKELLPKLHAKKIPYAKFSETPFSPWGIRVAGRPFIGKWPEFLAGEVEVQDEGSQILSALVAPKRGEMVIDFCAGAGGKTLLLGALMRSTGRLYAFDVSSARLARAKPRFARSGLSNVVPVVIDEQADQRIKRLRGKAQRVLVDAPCSGLGTLRRNPDLKWRQHPDSLEHYLQLQRDILARAATCVAPGGRLVYATCSILESENQQQVDTFLATHPDFTLVAVNEVLKSRIPDLHIEGDYLQLRPDQHNTDGFFAAVMEKKQTVA